MLIFFEINIKQSIIKKKKYMKSILERNLGFMGYPDYSVDTEGNIWSIGYNNTKEIKKMKPAKTKGGYLRLPLTINNKAKSYLVHRLVALAFIPNPNNYPEVNHKNEDKTDNRVENLEWCDRSYNINYGNRLTKFANSISKSVIQYTLDGVFVREWKSVAEIRREKGYDPSYIAKCCRGIYKTCYNFIWKYKDSIV